MNVQEFDTALSDLETRVDRLRALYENWFRGYEKLEPSVARKDVERRVYGLRKELPRNTALRFRYHQVYQRYTTLATYWQRTARQIEEGTYRLQLQRMKRRRPDDDDARTIAPRRGTADDADSLAPPSYELNLDESLDVRQLLDELDLDQVARAIDVPGPHTVAASTAKGATPEPASARTSGRFARPSMGPLASDALTSSRRPPPAEGELESTPPILRAPSEEPRVSMRAPDLTRPAEAALRPDEGTLGPRAPGMPTSRPSLASAPTVEGDPMRPPVANNNGTPPRSAQTFAKPAALKVPALTPPAMLKSAAPTPPQGPATGGGHRIIPPAPPPSAPGTGLHGLPGRPPPPPVPATTGGPRASMPLPPLPARPSLPTQPSAQLPPRAAPPAAAVQPAPRVSTPSMPVARPPQPSMPAARPEQPAGATDARPQRSIPAAAPTTAARAPQPASPAPRTPAQVSDASSSAALNEQRMRRIYDEYAAARKKNNEGDVRYETLASSIQKMLPDLSKKHQGKQIDFEVVLKDGRVGLKPKAT